MKGGVAADISRQLRQRQTKPDPDLPRRRDRRLEARAQAALARAARRQAFRS